MRISALASMLRASSVACAPGHLRRAPTPRCATAAIDLISRASRGENFSTPRLGFRSLQHRQVPTPGGATMAPVRRFSSNSTTTGSNALPVLTQTDFFDLEDIAQSHWRDPLPFLLDNPAIQAVQRHNNMIVINNNVRWMLSASGREFWQSAVELVFSNKLRGYDIARALVLGNLKVSAYGRLALKEPLADVYDGSKPFMGYKALRRLFELLMEELYSSTVILELTPDVSHFLDTLDSHGDDRLCLFHAMLLAPCGRASVSIRLHNLARNEVNIHEFQWEDWELRKVQIHEMLRNLSHKLKEVEKLHPFFPYWSQYREKQKQQGTAPLEEKGTEESHQDSEENPHALTPCPQNQTVKESSHKRKAQAPVDPNLSSGYSIVAINRNGVLHRIAAMDVKELTKSFPVAVARGYPLWKIVQLLHYYLPLLLPEAQFHLMKYKLWKYLEMGSHWPRSEIFHLMAAMRIEPTDKSPDKDPYNTTLIIYYSLGAKLRKEDLKQVFGQFGEILTTRILHTKACAFVEFLKRKSADEAIRMLNGKEVKIGSGSTVITMKFAFVPGTQKERWKFGDERWSGGHYALQQTYDSYERAKNVEFKRDHEDKP